jgi:hypothetical protein
MRRILAVLPTLLLLGTVPSETSSTSSVGDNSTLDFDFTFKVTTSPTHVKVYLDSVLQTSGYTVALNANQSTSPGGTVSFTVAPGLDVAVLMQREVPYTQETELSPFTAYRAKTVEKGLDRIVYQVQQLARDKADAGTGGGGTPYTLPAAGAATLGGVVGTGSTTVCGTGQVMSGWTDGTGVIACVPDSGITWLERSYVVQQDETFSSGSYQQVTNLDNLLTVGDRYTFRCAIWVQGTVDSSPLLRVNTAGGSPTSFRAKARKPDPTSPTTETVGYLTAVPGTFGVSCTSGCSASAMLYEIEGVVLSDQTDDSLLFEAASANSTDTVSVLRGSACVLHHLPTP